jgi:hypothetical protein
MSPLDRQQIEPDRGRTENPAAPRPSVRWRVWPRPLLRSILGQLPALLPALLFLPVVLSPPLNHDVAAVLQFSQRWLAGEHLYSDLIDVNPPLIFVLNLLPAAIAAYTPLDAVAALRMCLLAYGLLCWWLAVRTRDRAAEGPAERAFLDALPILFLLGGGYDFGQREHLMAVGALPYVLAAARRAGGEKPRGRIAIGVLAGIAFALKPHFLAIPGLIELGVLASGLPVGAGLRRGIAVAAARWVRDPVPWLMALVWALYLASLPLVFPDYFGTVVPLVWDFYLELGGYTIWQVLIVPRLAAAYVLLLPLVWIAFRYASVPLGVPGGALPRLLGLAGLGALASAIAQHKGWSYHIVPIEFFGCALGAVLAARWLDRVRASVQPPGPRRIAAALVALFGLYAISNGEAPWKELSYPDSDVAGLTALLKESAAGERVLVLSPAIYPIFPALNYAGVQATLRTMNMWLLQGAYDQCLPDGRRYREVWEMGRAEFFVYRTVAEDFARAPPAAVVVDMSPGIPYCSKEFDFIEYFKRHPLFAEVWSHYQLTGEWGGFRVYTLKD